MPRASHDRADGLRTDADVSLDRLIIPTSDARRLASEYTSALGAVFVGQTTLEPELLCAFGIADGAGIRCELSFSGQRVDLVEVRSARSRPYPTGSTATDLWFQHFALVVDDIDRAYAAIREAKTFASISQGNPVRLPPSSGGVTAVKFRDFDGHPLELLQVDDNQVSARKRSQMKPNGAPRLDHTAISVADTTKTAHFFQQVLGFRPTASTCNLGPEQSALDSVAGVGVRVTKLRGVTAGVALELLDYNTGTRRPVHPSAAAYDIAATHTVFATTSLDPVLERLIEHQGSSAAFSLIKGPDGRRLAVLTDPDHHRLIVEEAS
jgi:catechol 2,3-dioxygenase-like lactoylglutathione lyase family enzyme